MIKVSEIAPDVYRISVFVQEINLQFNHFLIKDDEPMLYHAGMRQMFPALLEAVSKIISPSQIRWIGFSHFEVDECGALNEWLHAAPDAKAVCSEVITNQLFDKVLTNTGNRDVDGQLKQKAVGKGITVLSAELGELIESTDS
jgi:flavorubredoxin